MRILIPVESFSVLPIDIFGLFSPGAVGDISAVYFGFGPFFILGYLNQYKSFGWLASPLHHLETGNMIDPQPTAPGVRIVFVEARYNT